MRVLISIIFLVFLILSELNAQNFPLTDRETKKGDCDFYMRVLEYDLIIDDFSVGDTVIKYLDSTCVKFFIHSCDGMMDVEEWYIDSTNENISIKLIGHYAASLDLLKRYLILETGFYSDKMTVDSYYQPLQDGVWEFYSRSNKRLRKESYDMGILIISPSTSPND